MWSALQNTVLDVIRDVKSDVRLSSLFMFQRFTTSLVFAVSSMIPMWMGPQIECVMSPSGRQQVYSAGHVAAVHSYCLIEGIFTVSETKVKSHTYYIWIPYVLVVCFLSCHIAYVLYQHILGGSILNTLLDTMKIVSKNKANLNVLLTRARIRTDSSVWFPSFAIYEIISFLTPVLQFCCLNILLDGKFLFLGVQDDVVFEEIFPKTVKCTFYKFGPAGSLQNHDTLCILPSNMVNEVIFFFLWFWLLFSSLLSIHGFFWRLLTFFCFRLSFFNQILWCKGGISLAKGPMYDLLKLSKRITFSEWLYVYSIYENASDSMVAILLRNCCSELNLRDNDNECAEKMLPLLESGELNVIDDEIGCAEEISPLSQSGEMYLRDDKNECAEEILLLLESNEKPPSDSDSESCESVDENTISDRDSFTSASSHFSYAVK